MKFKWPVLATVIVMLVICEPVYAICDDVSRLERSGLFRLVAWMGFPDALATQHLTGQEHRLRS